MSWIKQIDALNVLTERNGTDFFRDTAVHCGRWGKITFLESSTFTSCVGETYTGTPVGTTYAAGVTIYGEFVALKLASGAISAARIPGRKLRNETVDWVGRVITNGGTLPALSSLYAVDDLYTDIMTAGIDSKMVSMIPVVPDNLLAAATPMYKAYGNDPWTNTNFIAGDLTVNGLVGNGSSKYLNSGVIPATHLNIQHAGVAHYVHTGNNLAEADWGCADGTNSFFYKTTTGPGMEFQCWNGNAGEGKITNGVSNFTGYVNANRLDPQVDAWYFALYIASSTQAHTAINYAATTGGAAVTTRSIYAFANNNSGTAATYSTKRISFYAIHTGLTSAESAKLYAAIQKYRTALGGGYV